jgi:hypothetical protein
MGGVLIIQSADQYGLLDKKDVAVHPVQIDTNDINVGVQFVLK